MSASNPNPKPEPKPDPSANPEPNPNPDPNANTNRHKCRQLLPPDVRRLLRVPPALAATATAALAALGVHLSDQGLPEGGRPSVQ